MACYQHNTKSWRNLNLQDAKCLLLQFISNERKKPIQIGFQAWLTDETQSTSPEILVNKEVIIHWPKNVDIMSAKGMQEKLKNRTEGQDKWIDLPVKILAVGEWTEMYHQARNMEKFGVPNPNRKERHAICKKEMSDDDSSDKSTDDNCSKKNTSDDENKNESSYNEASKLPPNKKRNINSKSTTVTGYNMNAATLSQITNVLEQKENTNTISTDSDTDDYDGKQSRQCLLQRIRTLEEENHNLRRDNERLRTIQLMNEDLDKLQKLTCNIVQSVIEIQKIFPVQEQPDHYRNRQNKRINNETLAQNNIEAATSIESITNTNNVIDIGGRMVEEDKINRIVKSRGPSFFISNLMGIVFTQEEMATSSITGDACNFQKKTSEAAPKKQLNPAVRNAVIHYTRQAYNINKEDKENNKKINTAIRNKLTYEANKQKKRNK